MIKTTGAEFKRFYTDPEVWKNDAFHEEECILIDGVEADVDVDLGSVDDAAILEVSDGVIYVNGYDEIGSMEGLFRKWRKKQTTVCFAVEAPKEKVDAIKAAIKAAGGKVAK